MAELMLYGIIGDPADGLDAKTVCAAIRASTGPLTVSINSPGGLVAEGMAIFEALRSYTGPLTIRIDGLAASMGSVIAMAGDNCIMAESALMMIHRPWDIISGGSPALRAGADVLDKWEARMLAIYAKRTGLDPADLSMMLAAETWMDATEALAAGFVTSISQPLKLAAMAKATGYGFRHLPDRLKDETMPDAPDTATALATERTRASTIMTLCEKHNLGSAMAATLIGENVSLDRARDMILDQLAERSDSARIGHTLSGHVTLDNPATYAAAMTDAIAAKIAGTVATGAAAEFNGLTAVDMARDFLTRNGHRDATRLAPDRVMSMAMQRRERGPRGWISSSGPRAGIDGGHSTSDFPDLIGAASEKFLIARYKAQESPLKALGQSRSLPNFLQHYGVQLSSMGPLDTVNEGGEFRNRTLTTRKEGYSLQTFGNMFAVTRQMLINDELGALADVLNIMAAAATETEAMVLAGLININPLMSSDAIPWFDTRHKNLDTTPAPITIASLDRGRMAMRGQKDLDGAHLIDAQPKYILMPITLQTLAETLVASTISPTNTTEVNPFQGKLQAVSDPRLSNPTAWFLFADPNFTPALQYSYLNGQTAPFLDQEMGWRVDGTEYKVRNDFGAGIIDYRMAWKNPGA